MAYEVGFRRPPAHGRFRKGQSGNPAGRPSPRRAVERRFKAHIEAMLRGAAEAVARHRPADDLEAAARRVLLSAMNGDARALRTVFQLLGVGRRAAPRAISGNSGAVAGSQGNSPETGNGG